MKKLLLLVFAAILPAIAFSQYLSKEFTLDDSDVTTAVAISVPVSNADSVIILSDTSTASGLFVSGCANLSNDDDSYVRITLKDTDTNEYLIYELYPILAETGQCPFSKIGLETAYLDNIHPQSIRIETLNASVVLDSVYFVVPERSSRNMSKAIPNRKSQCEYIANKMNEKLVSGNKTWRAGVTFVSQMTFEEKKWLMGKNTPVLYGFDYYKGGVFVMPGFKRSASRNDNTRSSDNYVTEWDWRNRHGKNWVTSVKDQDTCKACWAFSAVGTYESYINLYYNKLYNYDLSEQEIISKCVVNSNCGGGYIKDALDHICFSGAIYETDFPYEATNAPYSHIAVDVFDRLKAGSYSNDYSESFRNRHSESYTSEEDSIKRMLFKSPITFGIYPWRHFVVLVGFKQFQTGNYYYTYSHNNDSIFISSDSLANSPAWLIKNSMGPDWGQDGFGYVAMSLPNAYGIHKLTGNVTSNVLTDIDIVCEDADGDGYYYWGIKDTTFTLPIWAPTEEDGDDSDCTKGPLDEFGNLRVIDPNLLDTIYIDMNTDYDTPQYINRHILVYEGKDFTVSNHVYCNHGVSITLERDATLYVEGGGMLENIILKPQPGSHIIIDNGCIKHNKHVKFKLPVGATMEQNRGTIE